MFNSFKGFLLFILIGEHAGCYCAEYKLLNEESMALYEVDLSEKYRIILVSLEGYQFTLPFGVICLSDMFLTFLKKEDCNGVIKTGIEDRYLLSIVKALLRIYCYEGITIPQPELYEELQDELYVQDYNFYELSSLYKAVLKIENQILEYALYDYFAQIIASIDSASLIDLLEELSTLIDVEKWYLIEKFYYLRSDNQQHVNEDFIFTKNDGLNSKVVAYYLEYDFFEEYTEDDLINITSTRMFNDMQLTQQDYFDYQKKSLDIYPM